MQLILAAYTGSQVNSSLGSIFTVSLVIFARVAACFKRDRLRRIGKGSYATVWKGRDDRRLAARTWHRMTTPPKKTRIMHGTRKWWMFKKEIPLFGPGAFRNVPRIRKTGVVKPWDQPGKPGPFERWNLQESLWLDTRTHDLLMFLSILI